MARPTDYNEQLALIICERIADGESIRTICSDEGMPVKSSIFLWLNKHKEFSDHYVRAREVQAELMAEEILQIADDGHNDTYLDDDGNRRVDQDVIARSRLRVDARKWLASKLLPKKYGERLVQEITGANGGPVLIQKIERVIVDPVASHNPD